MWATRVTTATTDVLIDVTGHGVAAAEDPACGEVLERGTYVRSDSVRIRGGGIDELAHELVEFAHTVARVEEHEAGAVEPVERLGDDVVGEHRPGARQQDAVRQLWQVAHVVEDRNLGALRPLHRAATAPCRPDSAGRPERGSRYRAAR